jgi:RNA polymerase sigma-70 factor (sigma-E family)
VVIMVEVGDKEAGGAAGIDDADAVLGALFRLQYGRLVGLARLLLDDRAQAEEVVQEAFARTYASWSRIRDRADALPYVRQVVVNLARGGLRRRRTARGTRLTPAPDAESAETVAATRERKREIADAVRALPRRQRECVVLRYYVDCSIAETASALKISGGSVKQHLHRAHAALALDLGTEDEQ